MPDSASRCRAPLERGAQRGAPGRGLRPRDGSRRARRTSAARGGGRTDPAPTRPAGRSRRRRRRRCARRRPRCASADRGAGRRRRPRRPTARAARSSGRRPRPARALGGADRVARGERLAGARRRDEQEVRLRVRGVAREELGLPRPRRDHDGRAPFSRLQRGHSAWPFAGSVAPPALTGSTWSPCQPGCSGSPHAGSGRARPGTGRLAPWDGSDARPSRCIFASRRRVCERSRCRIGTHGEVPSA